MSTWLPGTWGLPSTWRSNTRTMLILTNAVTIKTAIGASRSTRTATWSAPCGQHRAGPAWSVSWSSSTLVEAAVRRAKNAGIRSCTRAEHKARGNRQAGLPGCRRRCQIGARCRSDQEQDQRNQHRDSGSIRRCFPGSTHSSSPRRMSGPGVARAVAGFLGHLAKQAGSGLTTRADQQDSLPGSYQVDGVA